MISQLERYQWEAVVNHETWTNMLSEKERESLRGDLSSVDQTNSAISELLTRNPQLREDTDDLQKLLNHGSFDEDVIAQEVQRANENMSRSERAAIRDQVKVEAVIKASSYCLPRPNEPRKGLLMPRVGMLRKQKFSPAERAARKARQKEREVVLARENEAKKEALARENEEKKELEKKADLAKSHEKKINVYLKTDLIAYPVVSPATAAATQKKAATKAKSQKKTGTKIKSEKHEEAEQEEEEEILMSRLVPDSLPATPRSPTRSEQQARKELDAELSKGLVTHPETEGMEEDASDEDCIMLVAPTPSTTPAPANGKSRVDRGAGESPPAPPAGAAFFEETPSSTVTKIEKEEEEEEETPHVVTTEKKAKVKPVAAAVVDETPRGKTIEKKQKDAEFYELVAEEDEGSPEFLLEALHVLGASSSRSSRRGEEAAKNSTETVESPEEIGSRELIIEKQKLKVVKATRNKTDGKKKKKRSRSEYEHGDEILEKSLSLASGFEGVHEIQTPLFEPGCDQMRYKTMWSWRLKSDGKTLGQFKYPVMAARARSP